MAGMDLNIADIGFRSIARGGGYHGIGCAERANRIHLAVYIPIDGRRHIGNHERAVFLRADADFIIGVANDLEISAEPATVPGDHSDLHARDWFAAMDDTAANHGAI